MPTVYVCAPCGGQSNVQVHAPPEQHAARIRFATCPKCGRRNPEGLREAEVWGPHTRVLVVTLATFLSAAAYVVPVAGAILTALALIVPHLVGMALRKRAGEPVAAGGFLRGLHFGAALVFASWFWPRVVFLAPLAVFLVPLVQRHVALRAEWSRAARELEWLPG